MEVKALKGPRPGRPRKVFPALDVLVGEVSRRHLDVDPLCKACLCMQCSFDLCRTCPHIGLRCWEVNGEWNVIVECDCFDPRWPQSSKEDQSDK